MEIWRYIRDTSFTIKMLFLQFFFSYLLYLCKKEFMSEIKEILFYSYNI